jgi:hypothetical protein
MSTPAIYIAPQGTTSHVSPRYTRPTRSPCAPRGPRTSWCGISDSPYAIRNSEFGIPESGIGKSDKLWRGSTHFARTPVNIGPDAVHIFLMVRYFPA